MKYFSTFIIVGLAFLCIQTCAHSSIGLSCDKCGGNMPLNVMGEGIAETHKFRVKAASMLMRMEGLLDGMDKLNTDDLLGAPTAGKYLAAPTDMNMYMFYFSVGYSFTDDFFAGLMLVDKKNEMDMRFSPEMEKMTGEEVFTMRSEGMADTMLVTKYRLYADDPIAPSGQASLFLGLSLPTGSINERNTSHPTENRRDELLPYAMQLGTGTFDPKLGLIYQGSSSPLWWGANFLYTGRWYENSRNYRLGDELRLDLYTMYQIGYNLLAEIQINGAYGHEIRGEMDEIASGKSGRSIKNDPNSMYMTPLYNHNNYGGTELLLTLGLQWRPMAFNILELSAGIPIYQNLNGPQMREDFRVTLSWQIEIPTSSSTRYMGKDAQEKSGLGF